MKPSQMTLGCIRRW